MLNNNLIKMLKNIEDKLIKIILQELNFSKKLYNPEKTD
jgi:hypothetical protein